MKPATRKALRLSINKWEKIVAGTGVDKGEENCALCKRFRTGTGVCIRDDGEHCPVVIDSGDICCRDTPFMDWLESTNFRPDRARDDESVMCAQLELEYLRSLDK